MITVFSIISVIICMNMLIAFLNIVYQKIKKQSSLEISEIIYSLYSN